MNKLLAFDLENALLARLRAFSAAVKTAFFTALGAGLATHIVFFTGTLFNEDSIKRFRHTSEEGISGGRWLGNALGELRMNYSPPFLIGLLTILFVAVASVIVCHTLGIRSRGGAAVASLLIVTFPVTAYTAGYIYAVDGYMLSFALAAGAVACVKRHKLGFLPGAVCLALSLAIYQAYLMVAASLALFWLVTECVRPGGLPLKKVGLAALRCLAMAASGYALYYLSVRVSLLVTGSALTSYRGIDTMGAVDFSSLPRNLLRIYYRVFGVLRGEAYPLSKWGALLAVAAFLSAAAMLAASFVSRRGKRSPASFAAALGLLALSPVALYTLPILTPQPWLNMLVMYSFILPFVFVCALADTLSGEYPPLLRSAAFAVLLLLSARHFTVSEIYYLKIETYNRQAHALYNRVMARVEPLFEYSPGRAVYVIGSLPNYYYAAQESLFGEFAVDQGLWGPFIGVSSIDDATNNSRFARYASDHLGIPVTTAEPEDIDALRAASPSLPIWPEEGSVFLRHGVIIINLGHPVIDREALGGASARFTARLPARDTAGYTLRWLLEKDGVIVEARPPGGDFEQVFDFAAPGTYRVLCDYRRDGEIGKTARTDYFEV
ncbi:MAG: glucosyltransferase domain-containing protein [Oscillospiraceae bacterium]|jgi:hypothetical protein|nr:glucosyltransferase domain-containing protein [Oscillospiraceae bacterium]